MSADGTPAGPQLMRVMNEQLVLSHIRRAGALSRADVARISRLSKPTVSLALNNLERAGLVRPGGTRTGIPGPAAVLYEMRPEAGSVLALDVGSQFLRGAICDLAGTILAKATRPVESATGAQRVAELVRLAEKLYAGADLNRSDITQTVLGSPGIYDPRCDALMLAPALPGWEEPEVLAELRKAFGESLMVENDIDAAALAEQAHGHGRGVDNFAFVSLGAGIGMGLVLDGRLRRGVHGAAGEIGYLPFGGEPRRDPRRLGQFEAAASGAGVLQAARRADMRHPVSARNVFAAAARGDERASRVVAEEAVLVAKAICAVVSVVDPELVVLGGGIGQAAGLLDAVRRELHALTPIQPELRVSALGNDAVVDGCLAAGVDRAWATTIAAIHAPESP